MRLYTINTQIYDADFNSAVKVIGGGSRPSKTINVDHSKLQVEDIASGYLVFSAKIMLDPYCDSLGFGKYEHEKWETIRIKLNRFKSPTCNSNA